MAGEFDALAAKYGVSGAPAAGDPYAALAAKYGVDAKPAAPPAQEEQEPPGLFDRIGASFSRLGAGIAAGAHAVGHVAREGLTEAERGIAGLVGVPEAETTKALGAPPTDYQRYARARELARGVDMVTSLGHGQRLADAARRAFGGETELQQQQADIDSQAAAPEYRTAGAGLGLALPNPLGAAGRAAGGLVRMASPMLSRLPAPVAGAARTVAGYELTAPVAAGLSAGSEGHRTEAALDAATDPAGLILSVTAGAAGAVPGMLQKGAPERMLKRAGQDITTGPQNASIRTTRKVVERLGDANENLQGLMDREPALGKAIATQAKANPGKALKVAEGVSERLSDELDDVFDKMGKAKRVVTPAAIDAGFQGLVQKYLATGDLDALKAIRAVRTTFNDEYANFGALGPDALRGLKRTAGRAAFAGDPTAPASTKAQVQREVWGVFADAIEKQAASTPGVDLPRLREVNRDLSVLIPVEQSLSERATQRVAGRSSLSTIGKKVAHAALIGGGAHLGPAGIALAMGTPAAARGAARLVRGIDYGLAQAARRGIAPASTTAATGARAASLDYAARVSQRMKQGMSLKDAVAEEE